MGSSSPNTFSIAEFRAIVADLFTPNLLIYWADLLISITIAYTFAVAYLFFTPLFSAQQILCLIVAGFALHRVDNFIHEISHFRTDARMRSFVIGWNLLAGIPTLMPSFFFDNHLLHHRASSFGTNRDCEYVPLGLGRWKNVAFFMSEMFLQPIFVIIRFTLVTPVSFLHPRWRQWVLENFSSFVFVWPCHHKVPKDAPRAAWAAMDISCWLWATLVILGIPVVFGPWYFGLQIYVLAVFGLLLHYLRSLTAHNYLSDGEEHSFHDQFFDSIDIIGGPIFTELLYPVGLRYHALHHLFPSMPYHNLGRAHRRLMAQLPADSPYHKVVYPSCWAVLKELVGHVSSHPQPLAKTHVEGPVG